LLPAEDLGFFSLPPEPFVLLALALKVLLALALRFSAQFFGLLFFATLALRLLRFAASPVLLLLNADSFLLGTQIRLALLLFLLLSLSLAVVFFRLGLGSGSLTTGGGGGGGGMPASVTRVASIARGTVG
jgi:hypothetical protein